MSRTNGKRCTEEAAPSKMIEKHLGGYHRCVLSNPSYLDFVSENLCEMLGYTKPELTHLIGKVYTALIHPDDNHIFDEFACRLATKENCESTAYRLIKKDGSIIKVVDTMVSVRGNDDIMRGYSVVCEIPDEKMFAPQAPTEGKIAVMRVLNGKDPKIDQACGISRRLFGLNGEERGLSLMDYLSLSDRESVQAAFENAYENEYSGMVPCTIVSAEGRGLKCDLWIERNAPGSGIEDASFCVKAEADFEHQQESETVLSFGESVFSSFAEDVFEADRFEDTVKCISESERNPIGAPLNVRMNADDFTDWFLGLVVPKYRDRVRAFCRYAHSLTDQWSKENLGPKKLRFEMLGSGGSTQNVALVLVPVSKAKYFMCLNTEFEAIGAGFCSVALAERKDISARLFGSFRLDIDGEAVHIKSEKGRELLALLIEKRGAYLTTREAITQLYECEPDEKSRANYRKTSSRLMAELKKLGIDYIIESERGARRIVPEFISCDYYDYRDGLIEPSDDFLPEYSWSEYVRIQ